MTVPTVSLPEGALPVVGFGTWGLDDTQQAVETALDAGYVHLDTAEGYRNEAAIGAAIEGHDREKLFLTSKVLPKNLDYESVISSCRASLDRLGTEYLDLYLIHWPNPAISVRETLAAMATLHDRGLVRNVGVSNFSAYQLSAAHHVTDVPIAVNQLEFHPWFQRPELLAYCRETGVVVEAAAPLARTEVLGDRTVQAVATEYDRTPAQVVLRWAVEKDVVVLPKSGRPEHIRENVEVFDWELAEEDHRRLDERDRDSPVYDTPARDWTGEVYGITP